jgi:hypothetical protein
MDADRRPGRPRAGAARALPVLLATLFPALGLVNFCQGAGTIAYDAETGTLHVYGHPPEAPATPAAIARASRDNGWSVIEHAPRAGAYTVTARLRIGKADGSVSTFRIGSAEHSKETLVMRADLVVNAAKKGRLYRTYEGRNALILGDPDDASVRPALRFDCSEAGAFGLVLEEGASLLAWNASIGALKPDPAKRAGWRGTGHRLRLVNCIVEGFDRLAAFQTGLAGVSEVRGTTFQDIGIVFANGAQYAEDCVFRRCGVALRDGGGLHATVVRCRFEQNRRNWRLRGTRRGIRAIDCVFGAPAQKKVECRSHVWSDTGERTYPLFIAQQHLVFIVRNTSGAPVAGATVALTCEQASSAPGGGVIYGRAQTDANGRTPAPRTHRALFVTDEYCLATDDPEAPERRDYTYAASVSAPGFAPTELDGLDPDAEDPIVRVTLRR